MITIEDVIHKFGLKENGKLALWARVVAAGKKIEIPSSVLKKMIDYYKKIGSWQKVAEKYHYTSSTIINRIKEYMGTRRYNEISEKYRTFQSETERPLSFPLFFARMKLNFLNRNRVKQFVLTSRYELRDSSTYIVRS